MQLIDYSGRSKGGARGARLPLFLDQTEARMAEKNFLRDRPPPPLSQGLDPALDYNRELKQQRFWETDVNRKWAFCIIGQWFGSNSRVNRLYKGKGT